MNPKKLSAVFLALTLAGLSLASPASAQTLDQTPADAPLSVTVPLFGTSMVITIVTGTSGGFVSADLTPSPAPDALSTDPATATGFQITVDPDGHGGFEVKFANDAAGVGIEVTVTDGTVAKTEVETHAPADATGAGQWTGDPLGNTNNTTVDYSVALDANGDPIITVSDPVITGDPIDTFFVVDPATSSAREGELVVTRKVLFYNAPDATGAQDSMELVIRAKVENGRIEIGTKLVDPNASRGDDNHESGDQESGDRGSVSNEDHASDRGSDQSGDKVTKAHNSDDNGNRTSSDRGSGSRGESEDD